jgi:hypothetical protein
MKPSLKYELRIEYVAEITPPAVNPKSISSTVKNELKIKFGCHQSVKCICSVKDPPNIQIRPIRNICFLLFLFTINNISQRIEKIIAVKK